MFCKFAHFRQIWSMASNLIHFVTFDRFHQIWWFSHQLRSTPSTLMNFRQIGSFLQIWSILSNLIIFVDFDSFSSNLINCIKFARHLIHFVYFDEFSPNWFIFVKFDRWRHIWFICHVQPISWNLMFFSWNSMNSVYFDEFSSNWIISAIYSISSNLIIFVNFVLVTLQFGPPTSAKYLHDSPWLAWLTCMALHDSLWSQSS